MRFRPRAEQPECFAVFLAALQVDQIARSDAQGIASLTWQSGLPFRGEFEGRHFTKYELYRLTCQLRSKGVYRKCLAV